MPTPTLNVKPLISSEGDVRFDQAHMAAAAFVGRHSGQTLGAHERRLGLVRF